MQPEPRPRAERVTAALEGLQRPALVLSDTALDPVPADVLVRWLGRPDDDEAPAEVRTVLLAVTDLAALRAAVHRLPPLGRVRFVACVVDEADAAVPLRPRPAWPAVVGLDARLVDGSAVTVVRLLARVDAAEVLTELARAAAPAPDGHQGVRVRRAGGGDAGEKVPPDVLLRSGAGTRETGPAPSPVLGRAPVVVDAATVDEPVDEGVFNPIGFRRDWTRGVTDLDPGRRATPGLVASLRDAQGGRVPAGAVPHLARAVAASGVPLVRPGEQVDLDDPLRREEHSVRQRRAALAKWGRAAWRADLARYAGVGVPAYGSVSILLVSRRPELLDHALRQVARQRQQLPGAEVELVLVGHGSAPEPARVREALGDRPHTVLERPAGTGTGDLLRAAAEAARGDLVLTMDEADWYGPDVVTDLLLARRYSGADLVGMPAELVYLEPTRTTVRRQERSEAFDDDVAGGPVLLDRALLRELGGGFRPDLPPAEQAAAAVRAAGGRIYRTHGLGYLQRRTDAGPTGDPLGGEVVVDRWRGFRPSVLLEPATDDIPT